MLTTTKDHKLIYRYDGETLQVEAWGPNAVRVRSTYESAGFPAEDWALSTPPPPVTASDLRAEIIKPSEHTHLNGHANGHAEGASGGGSIGQLTNGKVQVQVTAGGKLTVRNSSTNKLLLEEYVRNRNDPTDPNCSALLIDARDFRPIVGSDQMQLVCRFESLDAEERIYGMGQYQQPYLNLKGADLELAQRNSQASVPFATSSLGYGFLWNNPAVGRAVFGKNLHSFEARATKCMDYWLVAGDSPAEIQQAYAGVTGTVPMMPEYGLGFWQCKLRYQTQDELLGIAREHKRRGLPLDVIVVDFFHWPLQGEWKFDKTYWPDPGEQLDKPLSFFAIAADIISPYPGQPRWCRSSSRWASS